MYSNVGRPSKVKSEDIINTVLLYKNRIIISDKIISKHDVVWFEISSALCNHITPASLYTIVSCNRYGIRDQLTGSKKVKTFSTIALNLSDSIDSNMSDSIVNEKSIESINEKEPINFIITIPKHEFEELITFQTYKRMQRNKMRNRVWKTLRPGIWKDFITHKIWDAIQLKCGFRFRNHYLSIVDTSGYINGNYKILYYYILYSYFPLNFITVHKYLSSKINIEKNFCFCVYTIYNY